MSAASAPAVAVRLPHAPLPPATGSVAIVGLGYVGLPLALSFLADGRPVVGFDTAPERLAAIRRGRVDLIDHDHERLRRYGRLGTFTRDPAALSAAEVVFICVPTPVDENDVPDLRALRSACATVAEFAVPGQVLIMTSTTYVGSTRELLAAPLAERGLVAGSDVFVAFSPERINPGSSDHLAEDTPRVIGGITELCATRAAAALSPVSGAIHRAASAEIAEMSKLLENTFRAVNIALANEIADACATYGLPVAEVIDAAATKPYGFMAFRPGPGVGGHCVPCDPHYLTWGLRRRHGHAPLVEQALAQNRRRPWQVVAQARAVLDRPLAGARVLVAGVAYKPGVADVRETPAVDIIAGLLDGGAEVGFVDPLVERLRVSSSVELLRLAEPGAFGADLVIIHTAGSDLGWLAPGTLVLDATFGAAP